MNPRTSTVKLPPMPVPTVTPTCDYCGRALTFYGINHDVRVYLYHCWNPQCRFQTKTVRLYQSQIRDLERKAAQA